MIDENVDGVSAESQESGSDDGALCPLWFFVVYVLIIFVRVNKKLSDLNSCRKKFIFFNFQFSSRDSADAAYRC